VAGPKHHATSRSKRTPVKGIAVGAITTQRGSKLNGKTDSHAKHLRFDVEDDDRAAGGAAIRTATAAAAAAATAPRIAEGELTGAGDCSSALASLARAMLLLEPRLHIDWPKPRIAPEDGAKDSDGGRGAEAAVSPSTGGRASSVPASRPGAKRSGWRLPRWMRRIVGGAAEQTATNPRRRSAAPATKPALAGAAHERQRGGEFTAAATPSGRSTTSSRSQSVPRPRKPPSIVTAAAMAPVAPSRESPGAEGIVRVQAWSRPAGQSHIVDAVPIWPPRIGGWTWHGEHELPATEAVVRALAGLDSPLQPWIITDL
jgi:hypothetical protein